MLLGFRFHLLHCLLLDLLMMNLLFYFLALVLPYSIVLHCHFVLQSLVFYLIVILFFHLLQYILFRLLHSILLRLLFYMVAYLFLHLLQHFRIYCFLCLYLFLYSLCFRLHLIINILFRSNSFRQHIH